jgi:hypothetical protein
MQIDWFDTLLGIYLIWVGIRYGRRIDTDE